MGLLNPFRSPGAGPGELPPWAGIFLTRPDSDHRSAGHGPPDPGQWLRPASRPRLGPDPTSSNLGPDPDPTGKPRPDPDYEIPTDVLRLHGRGVVKFIARTKGIPSNKYRLRGRRGSGLLPNLPSKSTIRVIPRPLIKWDNIPVIVCYVDFNSEKYAIRAHVNVWNAAVTGVFSPYCVPVS